MKILKSDITSVADPGGEGAMPPGSVKKKVIKKMATEDGRTDWWPMGDQLKLTELTAREGGGGQELSVVQPII